VLLWKRILETEESSERHVYLAARRVAGDRYGHGFFPDTFCRVDPVGCARHGPQTDRAPRLQAITDTPELRKARGAFFTPPEVARYICDWAIRTSDDRIYEPSCGEADFLLPAGERLRRLGAEAVDASHLRGAELHRASAEGALAELAEHRMTAGIDVSDFFDVDLPSGSFDAIVGNPPYVRYQAFQGEPRAKAQRAALRAGVRLSGLASSWAAFTVRCGQLARPEGRLGFVLPAELLSTNYAGSVRRYLAERFASVRLIMFDERVFPGVLAEVVLLLAEGHGPADCIEVSQARNLDALDDPPVTKWRPADPEAKWTPALLPREAAEAYAELLRTDAFAQLDSWGATDLGMVTGNNEYFCLSSSQASEIGLAETELLRISPPGSRHLRGLTFTERAWRELAGEGRRAYLFAPRNNLEAIPSAAAEHYIAAGEKTGVQNAYKCRVRSPWWHVPRVRTPDLFLTYMNHETPRLIANEARVSYLNSVHGVTLRPELRTIALDLLPLGVLNSVTLLGAELVGRSYGGGILKIEPKEADLLPVPTPEVLAEAGPALRALRPQLAKHLRNCDLLSAVALVDRVLLFEHLGMKRALAREMREARAVLFARRVTRAGK
jgi:adenine-specific DNA-methyltransferase